MRALTPRGIVSESIIVLGVCAGLGLGVISRFDAEAHDAERDLSSARQRLAERGELERSHSDWAMQRERARAARKSVQLLSEPASDAAALHDRFMTIARTCDVRIERILPAAQAPQSTPAPPEDPDAPAPVRPTAVLANTIEAIGRYDSVVKFIEQVERMGFGRVNGVQIRPIEKDQERLVHTSLQTVHFAFDAKQPPAQTQASNPVVTP